MSSTVDHAPFIPRPREEPSTTHPSAAPSAPMGSSLPPFGSAPVKPAERPSLFPGSGTHAPEPPAAPLPAKIAELPKPVVSEAKQISETKPIEAKPVTEARPVVEVKPIISEPKPATSAGASLPSISNLDAPPQPPKESAGEPPKPATTISGPAVPEKATGAAAPAAAAPIMSTLNKPTEPAPGSSALNKSVEAPAPAAAPEPAMANLSPPSFPRPVEVKSVPDTPVNTGTPAGGTPRPVLDISQEPIQKSEPAQPAPTSAPEVAKTDSFLNGATEKSVPATPTPTQASSVPSTAAGQKRKFEDEADALKPEHTEKKAKADEPAKPDSKDGAAPADAAPAPRKVGRPKKSKTPAPVGRTQRKTRSQGPAEASL
ncbi:hypothetical protein ISF_08224 [Cordyceps fumosorosea ARSEF 2679]|uniref:Uncharacterized protein n=1 Tax=Cordyceps fumosorosea (strain ARSEF 2679) TaxID=1081104 RepID=A0A167MPW1_CORFA|nr:hypothetical protein ISF_08224 [Cordyceps fumosorosea ARSEF 2679]OAA54623.1 hypothetical protein ISF_08224 [Cordyceps fumosorosea ARSEF 2679]